MDGNTFYFEWEVSLMQWLQSWLGTVGIAIASFFTMFGEDLICVAIIGFLYWCWDKELPAVRRDAEWYDQKYLHAAQTVF